MPNGGGPIPPVCPPECQKIILDGDLVAAVFQTTCERIEAFTTGPNAKSLQNVGHVLEKLIIAENAAFDFQRAVLEGMGHTGPWPKCLSG